MSAGPDRVHLVIERTDGSRIVRLPAPRWLVSAGVALTVVLLVGASALYSDYVALKGHRAEFATLRAKLVEQQAIIDGFQERVAAMRAEIDGWRELREKIWQPFGPEAGPEPAAKDATGGKRNPGVGGPSSGREVESAREAQSAPPGASPLEELSRLAAIVAEEGEGLRALGRFVDKAGKILASLPSRWPVRGPVNSDFGRRSSPWGEESASEFHSGLDIGAARGTSVTAPAPGTVVFAGPHAEYGTALIVDHGHDIKTLYGHLSKILVASGDKVARGQAIGLTGNTGRSSGPHLHYEIQVAGRPVNPRSYLWD